MVEYQNPLLKDANKNLDSLFLFRKVKGCNTLYNKKALDIREMPFKDVQFIKDSINEPSEENMFKIIEMVFNFKDFKSIRLYEFFRAYNYIIEQIKQILIDEKILISEPSVELKKAGIDELNIFREFNIIDDVAKRYMQPPHEVEKWSYNWIFLISLKSKKENDIKNKL